jgi:uncharacterized membrane protein
LPPADQKRRWADACFAATLIVLGILGLIRGEFTPIWLPVPGGVPARVMLIYLTGGVALVTGAGLFWRRTASAAAGVLFGVFLAWLLALDVPDFALHPGMDLTWALAKTATVVAAAWVLSGRRGVRIARSLYGLALIVFGVAHFTYLQRTVSMVPGWLPWHLAWACLFGVTFVAAGLAVITGVYARLAAALAVVQLALFTGLVWVPVVVAGPSASDWSEFVVSWALTAAAWVVADSYNGVPWLAVGKG